MKTKKTIIIILLLAVLLLVGCYMDHTQQEETTAPQDSVVEPVVDADDDSQEIDGPVASGEEQDNNQDNMQDVEVPVSSTFEVHYIDVGQGDCSLILCDGHAMLVDGGESSESSKVYAYLKQEGIEHLDYIVATHAHSDHVGGLAGALNYATVGTVFCPVTEYDSKAFENFKKYVYDSDAEIMVPGVGDTIALGSASVQVLGPHAQYEDENDTSIVLRVKYGDTTFLFTGDAERTAEADILAAGYDISATVLKVGHHGSENGTSYPFLREVMPQYAVIQVGADNSYGHPTEAVLSRLRDAGTEVYRNDLQGTIICTSDGETVAFTTEKSSDTQPNPTVTVLPEPDDVNEYIGNKNSKKFHLRSCKNLPAEKNRIYITSRQEAIDGGFSPCGNCKP